MATTDLSELYIDKLKDLYSAEQQILRALPKMAKAAGHPELRQAFETHLHQTQGHVGRLEQIFEQLGKSAHGKTCHGMKGIIEEGVELMKENLEPGPLDAGLIAGAQSVEHYEMAGYGSVRTWAQQLGYTEHADLLRRTLEEERETDRLLTRLAEQSVNADAGLGLAEDEPQLADMPRRQASARPRGARPRSRPSADEG